MDTGAHNLTYDQTEAPAHFEPDNALKWFMVRMDALKPNIATTKPWGVVYQESSLLLLMKALERASSFRYPACKFP